MDTYGFLLNYSIFSTKRFRTEIWFKNLEYVFSWTDLCYTYGRLCKADKTPEQKDKGDSTILKSKNVLRLMFWEGFPQRKMFITLIKCSQNFF